MVAPKIDFIDGEPGWHVGMSGVADGESGVRHLVVSGFKRERAIPSDKGVLFRVTCCCGIHPIQLALS